MLRLVEDADPEDRRQGEKMIYDILEKKFRENPWFGMYYMDEWNMTPDKIPGLGELLDSYKKPIIISLLKSLKAGTSDDVSSVSQTIERLTKIGAKWPEMAIISKSVAADAANIVNESDDGEWADVRIGLILKNATGHWESEPYEPKLEKYKGIITFQLDDRLEYAEKSRMMDQYSAILNCLKDIIALRYYGCDWTELDEMIEKNKKTIVKSMLMLLRDVLETGDELIAIRYLRKLGIKWPELDIIERSINADSGKLNESDDDFMVRAVQHMSDGFDARRSNPHANIFPLNMLSRFDQMISDRELTTSEVKAALDSIKEKVIPYLLIETKKGQVDQREVLRNINELRGFGIDWPELAIIERSLKADLGEINEDDEISQEQRQTNFAYHQFIKCLEHEETDDIAYWLAKIGKNDLSTPLTKGNVYWTLRPHKREIMQSVLSAIKHSEEQEFDDDDLRDMVRALRKMHAEWPELDIIEKSINIQSKQIDEALSPDESEELLSRIEMALDEDAPEEAFEIIEEHGLTLQNTPELKSLLDQLLDGAAMMAVGLLEDYELSNILTERFRHQLEDMGIIMPNQKIADTINIYKNSIAKILIKMQKKGLTSSMVEVLDEFVNHWGVDLHGYLPKDKVSVMKMLLRMMKDGDGQYAIQYIKILRDSGIDIPEFKVIERSVQADAAATSR
jgi:hypothetical protein